MKFTIQFTLGDGVSTGIGICALLRRIRQSIKDGVGVYPCNDDMAYIYSRRGKLIGKWTVTDGEADTE